MDVDKKKEIEKCKSVIREIHNGYPRYLFYGLIEERLSIEAVNVLDDDGIIKKRDSDGKYRLTGKAIPLVSAWNTEDLAKRTLKLSKQIKNLTIIAVVFAGVSILRMVLPWLSRFLNHLVNI